VICCCCCWSPSTLMSKKYFFSIYTSIKPVSWLCAEVRRHWWQRCTTKCHQAWTSGSKDDSKVFWCIYSIAVGTSCISLVSGFAKATWRLHGASQRHWSGHSWSRLNPLHRSPSMYPCHLQKFPGQDRSHITHEPFFRTVCRLLSQRELFIEQAVGRTMTRHSYYTLKPS